MASSEQRIKQFTRRKIKGKLKGNKGELKENTGKLKEKKGKLIENDTCAWTPNKVFMRLGSLDTWAWVPRLGGESALFNRCFARSTCWQWVSRQV